MTICSVDPEAERGHLGSHPGKFELLSYRALHQRQFPGFNHCTMETVTDFIFLGSKITVDGDCSHEIKRCLLLGSTVMTSLAAAAAKLPQSCPTLCDPIDGSPPGSPVAGILQARTLEWVAFSSA